MIFHLINKKFNGNATEKLQKKRKIIEKKHYKYMAAFLANEITNKLSIGLTKKIKTPFGEVDLKITRNKEYLISKGKIFGDYINLSEYLDEKCCSKDILEIIYTYISMPYTGDVKSIKEFNNKINITESEDDYLAVFCGTLMIAEPLRFHDGGGHARGCIRRVYKLLDKNKPQPYSIVFSNAGKEFLGQKEAMAVFAHKGRVDRLRDYDQNQTFAIGGKQQELNQLLDEKEYENGASIEDNASRMSYFDEDVSDDEDYGQCDFCDKNSYLQIYEKHIDKVTIKLCKDCSPSEEFCILRDKIFQNVYKIFEKYNMTKTQQYEYPLYGIRDALNTKELTEELQNAKNTFIEKINHDFQHIEEIIKKEDF